MFDLDEDAQYSFKLPYLDNFAEVTLNEYGLYVVKLKNGVTPPHLDGMFTSVEKVQEALNKAILVSKKYKERLK